LKGRWRLFRHEAGRVAGPPPWVYVAMFVASLAASFLWAREFGAVAVWLSNGIMAAALLQLHRKQALQVLALCLAANLAHNLVRGDPWIFFWLNAGMNLTIAVVTSVLARRFCGAALDMRRPSRLARFVLLAAVPAVLIAAGVSMAALQAFSPQTPAMLAFISQTYISVELLGVLLVTPALLMFARAHRFRGVSRASRREAVALMSLSVMVTLLTFSQQAAPLLFLAFMPLVLIALRLSPPATAAAVLITSVLAGSLTLLGYGPVHLTELSTDPSVGQVAPVMQRLLVLNVFLLCGVITILPISTVVTERRRLETRLRARTAAAQEARRHAEEAAAARTRFLAMMSHEMRTPLNGVAGFADVLAGRPGMDPEAVRQARQIRRSSDGLLMLVEDVLDFARGETALAPEPLDMAAVIHEAVQPNLGALESKGLALEVRVPAGAPRRLGDRRALRQTLHALISNAVKFTERGGVAVELVDMADAVRLSVIDSGCGVDADARDRLFEAFEQGDASVARRHDGAGLGLALVARNVRRMGGAVKVGDAVGGGSRFEITLPLPRVIHEVAPVPVAEPVAATETEPESRAPRVLVVDDHPVNREVAAVLLRAFGCEVLEVCDGLEAVEAAEAESFDLVLMDVRMPVMDGLEATRRLRADPAHHNLPIVAMTADAMPEDVARCLAAGMDAHMAKPISQAGLLKAVTQALSGELTAPRARAA
jgi:two-component system, sensor histidine kinase